MTDQSWTTDELDSIGDADELHLAPRRKDGTPRRTVPIWVVRVGDELYVRSWRGDGGPVEVIRPGDRVFFEPGENHWHGAAPERFMAHIAMQQNDESGSPVASGEHVSEEQYSGARST